MPSDLQEFNQHKFCEQRETKIEISKSPSQDADADADDEDDGDTAHVLCMYLYCANKFILLKVAKHFAKRNGNVSRKK